MVTNSPFTLIQASMITAFVVFSPATMVVGGPGGDGIRCTWADTGARLADSTGGCVLYSAGGTCKVGSDGLPVELLSFGIE